MKNKIKIQVIATDDITEVPLNTTEVRDLVSLVAGNEHISACSIRVIFVNAEHIRKLNAEFLKHDYPTDVLTFQLNEPEKTLEGEIYVCSEVAELQAHDYDVPVKEELMRLVVHGMLHIVGYDDAVTADREHMATLGENYLKRYLNGSLLKK